MDTLPLLVSALDPARLAEVRRRGRDERGRALEVFPGAGWEPLRCCLSFPAAGEPVALISWSPFGTDSAWAESGPVYVHPGPCGGYPADAVLPPGMRTGPKILRSYRADGTLDYDHIALVPDGVDIAGPLGELLAAEEVATVHVRAVHSQCFGYAVSRRPA